MGRPDLASRALKMLRGCERGTTVEPAKPGSEQGSPRRGESPHERVGFADWRHSLCAAKRTRLFLPRGTQARGTGCSNLAYPSPPQFITIKKMQPHTRLHLWNCVGFCKVLNRKPYKSQQSAWSAVSVIPASPRKPSVPKYFPIFHYLFFTFINLAK